ncbi:MAG: hypothetical protein EOP49_35405, partial [Sphingobacteriales bacterium]
MKSVLITAGFIITAYTVLAQQPLSNRWKEVQRLDLSGNPATYTDTFRLAEVSKESISIRRGSFLYKGRIDNDVLTLGDYTFGIIKNDSLEIRLQDEESIHIFAREPKDMSSADARANNPATDLPAVPVTTIDKKLLAGNWEIYKRVSRSGPVSQVDYKTQIKSISFTEQKTGGYYGKVMASSGDGTSLYNIVDTQGSELLAEDKE